MEERFQGKRSENPDLGRGSFTEKYEETSLIIGHFTEKGGPKRVVLGQGQFAWKHEGSVLEKAVSKEGSTVLRGSFPWKCVGKVSEKAV